METDYTGAKSVAQIIEHTGLHKFIISRIASTRNSAPVYEFLTGSSNSKAIDAFNRWASITENGNLYEMLLFNELETNGEDVEVEKKGHNRNKSQSLKFTFTLTKQIPYNQQQAQSIDVAQAIENALMKHTQLSEEKESNRKIAALEAKIDALINRDLEDEDEEDDEDTLSGLGNPNIVNLITLITKLTGQKTTPPPAINGVKLSDDQIKNINIAIKKLAKYDDNIDTDLLKLAEIAKNNNETFKMVLSSLRTMPTNQS